MDTEPTARSAALGEVARVVMTLGLVVVAAAGLLRGLDSLPGWLGAEPRGVKTFDSIEAAERHLKARLVVPAYFPDTLAWPPAAVRVDEGPPSAVGLTFLGRGSGEPRLILYQDLGGPGFGGDPRSLRLLPAWVVLQRTRTALHGRDVVLTRLLDEDGLVWHEVAWEVEGRRLALRSRGAVDELLTIAHSTGGRR